VTTCGDGTGVTAEDAAALAMLFAFSERPGFTCAATSATKPVSTIAPAAVHPVSRVMRRRPASRARAAGAVAVVRGGAVAVVRWTLLEDGLAPGMDCMRAMVQAAPQQDVRAR
jgi:hypothetical protein